MASSCCRAAYGKTEKRYKIVMVRHGESEWNQKNLFCGWVNVNLSPKGEEEATTAGRQLKQAGYKFDIAYTSMLYRAHQTLDLILKEIGQTDVEIVKNWRLNERHYGALTGLNKAETAKKYGEDQVTLWRRGYDVPPPAMEPDHQYFEQIFGDPVYAKGRGPLPEAFPKFESLKMTIERTMPFWNLNIAPELKNGKQILVVAHGNSLRGIIKHLDGISDEDIPSLNLPTGMPFVYILDEQLRPVQNGSLQFLGDPEAVQEAMGKVANQVKENR